jgi:ATP-binding cassette, subfamily C, type I secretion system permease/ATPase
MSVSIRHVLRFLSALLAIATLSAILFDAARSWSAGGPFLVTTLADLIPAGHVPNWAPLWLQKAVLCSPVWLLTAILWLPLAALARARAAPAPETGRGVALLAPRPSPVAGTGKSELQGALSACRGAFAGIGLFTAVINILALTGSLFMLEIYDRVLPSRSVPTLVGLVLLVGLLLSIQGILDLIRSRVLVRIGASLDVALSRRVYTSVVRLPLHVATHGDGLRPLRDLDSLRSFLSGLGPTALFDLPWIPFYLGIIFVFHFELGVVALCGALFLVGLTLLTEVLTRNPTRTASEHTMERHGLAERGLRNAEVLVAMGMTTRMADHWEAANETYIKSQQRVADVTGGFGAVSKVARVMLQSGVLGVGAYLVIHQEATAGIIIAASILTARAFAPVDLAIAHWKGFVAARQGWRRLTKLLEALPVASIHMALPNPSTALKIEALSAAPPGGNRLVIAEVDFALKSSQGVCVIGPSGAGKSSLARLLVGVWRPLRGRIRLDGAELNQWGEEALGRHIGYLPQDVELFAGTIAQNIARFDHAPDPEKVIAAARAAGTHELIVGLHKGYDTELDGLGLGLSAGQQQRIALARALYGDPFLVVLDEPNSNLDAEGEAALTTAILGVRKRGGIVVVISHRTNALAGVDMVLIMNHGRVMAFGRKDEVLKAKLPAARTPIRPFAESGSLAS